MGLALSKYLDSYVTENYQNPLRPERPPLVSQGGFQALQRAEGIDQYRAQVAANPINRLARAGQNYITIPFSLNRKIPPPDLSQPWPSGQVVWMDPTADEGLPHTRPPYYIMMSRTFPEGDLVKTLLHERVHVHQRLYEPVWEKLVADAWEMKPWVGDLPTDIQARRRMNPDLLFAPLFIWKDTWVPLAIFKSSSQPKLTAVDIVWWNSKQRTIFREAPPGWTEFFGNNPAGEHPYEIAAYLIADNPSQNKAYTAIRSRLDSLPRGENI